MTKLLTYIIFLVFFSKVSFTQNDYPYGGIAIKYFSPKDYNSSAQNWDITQNSSHHIVIANNKSILIFDGVNWKNIKLNNQQTVRCLEKATQSVTYVAGDNEFGKIFFDQLGALKYKQLSKNDVGSIWNSYTINGVITFVTRKSIIGIINDTISSTINVKEGYKIERSVKFNNKLICIVKDSEFGKFSCLVLINNKLVEIENSEDFNALKCLKIGDSNYIINTTGKVKKIIKTSTTYKLVESDIFNDLFKNKKVYINSIAVKNGIIAIGTDGNGISLYNFKGNLIRDITKKDGLKNLLINKLFFDKTGNLWSAGDNGISLIDLSNPITYFGSERGINSTIEDLYFSESEKLMANHQGVFKIVNTKSKIEFKNTDEFNEYIFKIKSFTFTNQKTKKLVITNSGISEIVKNESTKISGIYAWDFVQSKTNQNLIWIGHEDGVAFLLYDPETDKLKEYKIKQTHGDVRSIVEHNGKVYYSLRNKGVVLLDSTRTQDNNIIMGLTKHNGGFKYDHFQIKLFQDKLYIGTAAGLYYLKDNKLIPFSDELNEKDLSIHRLESTDKDKLWLVMFHNSGKINEKVDIGYLDFSTPEVKFINTHFTTISQDIINTIKKDKDNNIWFGGTEKLFIYNPKTPALYTNKYQTQINNISINDSTIFNYVKFIEHKEYQFKWENNSIEFSYNSPTYFGGINNEYSFYLENWDNSWSNWSTQTDVNYPRLNEGEYVFHVKTKNHYNIESQEAIFTFIILPPWYRTIWAYFIYLFLGILLIYIIIKLSLKRVKDQNEKLEKIVEERTAEVELQKDEIEHKNRDIVDSIIYAKRIQNTILPTRENSLKILHKHFVIYKPKDIVSGDFFWIEELDGKAYFSAIDCTGHGVPGAFVSIVGFNGIKRTINEFKERQPAKILDKLTDIVIETFTASESHLKDGMDMALCSLDYSTLKLEFSGANNPLIIIRDGELIEIKGNKQPIGDFEHRKPFTNHEVQLQKEDSVFVFTDGFADQFGGPKGKKMKMKTLKNILIEVSTLPIKEQRITLEKAFNAWKGDLEQLDDVCLIGLKI